MDESSKLLLTVAIPTMTVLVGILVNNRQLDQLSRHMDQQLSSLRGELNARIEGVDGRITSLREEMIARLERVEGVLDARLKLVEEYLKIR